jgi:hypothetical protein
MQNFIPHQAQRKCYTGLCFRLKPRQRTPKHFEYDQIKTKIFGLKDEATKPLKREQAKTINCHYPDVL